MSAKNNAVVHFEMPYEDASRVAEFYKKSFGWDMQVMGEQWGGYVMAMTTDSTQDGPKNPGAINGGFFPKSPTYPAVTTVVVQVVNLEEAMKKVTEAGGKLLLPKPMEIPQVGLYMAIEDSEGNRVGVLQPAPTNG